MIIRSIRAENFMRFSRLEVADLPEEGLIAIEGPNESGKSTIGEVLLFVFFGRTRLSAEASLVDLIRWNADSLTAEVEFTLHPSDGGSSSSDSGTRYLMFRQIDRYGTNYVKVLELPDRREVAAGVRQVAEFVAQKIGFDFLEFQSSFYHDQLLPRRGQACQTAFIESAAGIRHLRRAAEDVRKLAEPFEREFTYGQKEISRNIAQLERHERNAAKIPDLNARTTKLLDETQERNRRTSDARKRIESLRAEAAALESFAKRFEPLTDATFHGFVEQLERVAPGDGKGLFGSSRGASDENIREALDSLSAELKDLRALAEGSSSVLADLFAKQQELEQFLDPQPEGSAVSRRAAADRDVTRFQRRGRRWTGAALLGGLACFGVIGLGVAGVARAVTAPPSWPSVLQSSLGWPMVVAGGGALALVVFGFVLGRKARSRALIAGGSRAEIDAELASAQAAKTECDALLEDFPLATLADFARRMAASPLGNSLASLRATHASFLEAPDARAFGRRIVAIVKLARDVRSRLLSEVQKCERVTQDEETACKKLSADRERLEAELRECQSQAAKSESIRTKNRDLEANAAAARREIDVRSLAARLLEDTAASVRAKLGPALTTYAKAIVPRLTSGRYREIRIDANLDLKVFSSDKGDFLSLHELSGGTSEAIHLAIRLAASHLLASARMKQAQFVFFDEPFKMMDSGRVLDTLAALRSLSPNLRQFFLAQPNLPPEARPLCALWIHTSHETTEPRVEGKPPAGRAREEGLSTHALTAGSDGAALLESGGA